MGTLAFTLLRTAVNVWSTTLGFSKLPTIGGMDADLNARTVQLIKLIQAAHPDWSVPSLAQPELVAKYIDKARVYPNTLLPAPPRDPVKKSSMLPWIAALGAAAYFFLMSKNTSRKGRGR